MDIGLRGSFLPRVQHLRYPTVRYVVGEILALSGQLDWFSSVMAKNANVL